MTWLVWRQHRAEALAAVIVVAIVAIAATPTALHLYQVTGNMRQDGCLGSSPGAGCGALTDAFNATSRALQGILPVLNLLPAFAGVFIGAPLVAREIEDSTWRLAWSQGITRHTWLRGQLAGSLAVTALGAALFTAVLTWWLAPLDHAGGRFSDNGFDFAGVIPLAWALLAFALGVLAGTVLRRVIPAMATTIAAAVAIRLPVEYTLRPRYLTPDRIWGTPFGRTSFVLTRDDWVLGVDPVAPGGHTVLTGAQFDQVQQAAGQAIGRGTSPSAYFGELSSWMTAHGYTQVVTYQPAGRFWAFQGIEGGICLILAVAVLTVAYRLILRP